MPKARSKQQFKLFQAVAHGSAKLPGMSKSEAAEMVKGQSPKDLPKYAKIKKALSRK